MDLLEGEEVRSVLRPHPLAFIKYWLIPLGLWIGGVLLWRMFASDAWGGFEDAMDNIGPRNLAAALAFLAMTLLLWVVIGFVLFFSIRRQWTFWLPVLVVGMVAITSVGAPGTSTALWYLLAVGLLGFLYIEIERRTYSYTVTTSRIVMRRAFLSVRERQVRIEHLQDLVTRQGLFGRLFNFGTVVPISASQIGVGDDGKALMAGAGVKGPLGRAGAGAGTASIRSKRMPTDDPVDVLFGVPDPTGVKTLLAMLLDDSSAVGELKKIRGLLEKKNGEDDSDGSADTDDEESPRPGTKSVAPSEGGQ
jgi:hypothetical protein